MEKRVQDYTQEILDTIRSNSSPAVMGSRLEDYHENDLADVLPLLTVPERCKLYRILDTDMLSDIFEYAESDNVAEYLEEMDVKKAASILSKMETDALAEVLQKLDKTKKRLLIDLLDPDVRHDIEMIASFDEDEIGSRMTTNCIIIREDLNVKQAMSCLIDQAAKNDNISTIFVVNAQQKFYGAIDLKNLIIARRDETLEDLTVTSYPYVYAEEPIDECIEELKDYSEDSIPVLDNDNRLLGVITSSSIIDLVDDEMGEDYAMFAGLTAEEDLKEPLKDSIKKRMPWLIVLLGLGLVVSSVVGMFEHVGPKNYDTYFAVVDRNLKPEGIFLLHTIGSKKTDLNVDPWINKYIFPNGCLPSVRQIAQSSEPHFVMEDWHNFGADYDTTLMAWYERFLAAWPEIADNYSERFKRMFTYYLNACAGAFRARDIQLWQVVFSRGVENGLRVAR